MSAQSTKPRKDGGKPSGHKAMPLPPDGPPNIVIPLGGRYPPKRKGK